MTNPRSCSSGHVRPGFQEISGIFTFTAFQVSPEAGLLDSGASRQMRHRNRQGTVRMRVPSRCPRGVSLKNSSEWRRWRVGACQCHPSAAVDGPVSGPEACQDVLRNSDPRSSPEAPHPVRSSLFEARHVTSGDVLLRPSRAHIGKRVCLITWRVAGVSSNS